ncbi:MAG: ABC transporter substrate-binding protein [Anaeromicrobium sp.]|jgi:peptide/nickel transport system substrate-binding protein|uniref:ABC transporter substrate-binding protein n=1 Tax=Anaeromicrobium sp. TaxID=1929132 RepID=UPI0025F5185C|nr:ABC transporter substrate-binding protein [Anaeromicrobium sp.]MCT4594928.1 ABC transporter substrate-binding protein [Anaeromicrobium sp.]
MPKFNKSIFLIIFIISLCLFQGCEEKEVEKEETKIVEEEKVTSKYGGTLKIPVVQYKTLNPLLDNSRSMYYFNKLIYESLFEIDEGLKINPLLAEDIDYIDDTTIVVTLKNNIKWQDGYDFNSYDVKFTVDALKKNIYGNEMSTYTYLVENIKSINTRGAYSVEIKLNKPDYEYERKLIFPIIPKHKFNTIGNVYASMDIIPVGTGPYEVQSYEKRKKILLKAREDYWNGKPYIDFIEGIYVPTESAALSLLQSGEVHVVEADYYDWDKYKEDENLIIHEFSTLELEFININLNNEKLKDVNLRKAIYYAIDRSKIIDDIYLGHGTVLNYPFINYDLGNNKKDPKDRVEAFKYLSNMDTNDRIKLNLLVNDSEERVKSAKYIVEDLAQLGIDLNIQVVNWDEYMKRIERSKYDMVLMGVDLKESLSTEFLLNSNQNPFFSYKNEDLNLLISRLPSVANDLDREVIKKEITDIYMNDMSYVSLFIRNKAIISSKKVKGSVFPNLFNIYNNINSWHIQH